MLETMKMFRRTLPAACAIALLVSGAAFAQVTAPVRPQAPVETQGRAPGYRAVTYDVRATVSPAEQMLSAQATVEFESRGPAISIECELHPNLRVSSVTDASGKPLDFERDSNNPLVVRVTLPATIPAGQRVKLTFQYAGQLPNEQSASPVPGVRAAWVGTQGAYLLLPGRWFPLTDFPSNRYTGAFHIEVPDNFAVAGTGTTDGPAPAANISAAPAQPEVPQLVRNRDREQKPAAPAAGPRSVYNFRIDRPQAAGTFVVGALQRTPVQAEGVNVSVFAPPAQSSTADAYGQAVARAVALFSSQFGPLPQPSLTIAQIPDGTVTSYAAPGLLLISARHWGPQPDMQIVSNLAASLWWGDQVMAASPSDVWLTDGLARYSQALYIEQTANRDAANHALEDFAVGALMYEDAAPIAEAGRLTPLTAQYISVVINKGAMVFHMLRSRLGDAAFAALLRDFYGQYSGKAASLQDFERIADARLAGSQAPPPTEGFRHSR